MQNENSDDVETWDGVERRTAPSIPSNRLQIILSALTALAAIVALIVAIAVFASQQSATARETCIVIRKISLAAGLEQGKLAETKVFLKKNHLDDCDSFGG